MIYTINKRIQTERVVSFYNTLAGLANIVLPFEVVNKSNTATSIPFRNKFTFRDKNYPTSQFDPSVENFIEIGWTVFESIVDEHLGTG